MSLEANKAIVRRLFDEVWNHGCIDLLGEILAPEFVDHRNDGTTVEGTLEDQKEDFAERFASFSKIQVTCDELIAEGDKVALRWIANAVNGTVEDSVTKSHICIYRIEDGKIAESWTCF